MSLDYKVVLIPDRYVVSFKRRRSGKLRNIEVDASGVVEAGRLAAAFLVSKGENVGSAGWREYGVSQSRVMLFRHVYFGAKVTEEWTTSEDWMGTVVEKRELSAEEIAEEDRKRREARS